MSYVNSFNKTHTSSDVTVRLADYSDSAALVRLAALDEAPMPDGPILLAEAGDRAVAALPLSGGPAIADPFHRSASLVEMLHLRARQLHGAQARGDGWRQRLRGALRTPRVRPHTS